MPSRNSYTYYKRFLRCIEQKYGEDKNHYSRWDDVVELTSYQFRAAIEIIFDELIRKAPSLTMGGDGWLDNFLCEADHIICSGMWCRDDHCKDNNGGYPYNCRAGNIPSKCKIWKTWRLQWRSFPEKEECQKCPYFKPYNTANMRYVDRKKCSLEAANKYRCLCRAKELPEGCPKRGKRGVK